MVIKGAIIIALMYPAQYVSAQFNDSTHYRLQVQAAGSINKANENKSYLLNNGLNFDIERERLTLNSASTYIYGRQNNNLTNNDISSTLTLNFYPYSRQFYYWGLANFNRSHSLNINRQLLLGAGLAYTPFENNHIYINVSNGLLWDQSNLAENQGYNLARNSFRFRLRLELWKALRLEHISFVQHALSSRKDYIIKSDSKLAIPLKKWISLNANLNYNKLSITQRENILLSYGLTLQQYW